MKKAMIDDVCTYTIEIRGPVDASDLNASSPLTLTVIQTTGRSTILSARTDQAGWIGLIRHLHSMGLIILSFKAETKALTENERSQA